MTDLIRTVVRCTNRPSVYFAWVVAALVFSPVAAQIPSSDNTEVEDVVIVTAVRRSDRVGIDKSIYEISTRRDAASLDLTEVLKRVPGLMVDSSNNVTMRGGERVSYLINGKPVRAVIAQAIPAAQIVRVEVIANPSAEFSTDGSALINLILRKTAEVGWSRTVSAKADTNSGLRVGLDVSRGADKTTFTGSLSFRHVPIDTETERLLRYDEARRDGSLEQAVTSLENQSFYQVSAQGNFVKKFSEDKDITIVFGVSANQFPQKNEFIETLSSPGLVDITRLNEEFEFSGLYPNGSITYEARGENDKLFNTSVELYAGSSDEKKDIQGLTSRLAKDDIVFTFLQGQAKYERSVGDRSSISVGGNLFVNDVDNHTDLTGFTGVGESQIGDFDFTRRMIAAYTTYQTMIAGVEFKAGIRLEEFEQTFKQDGETIDGFDGESSALPSLHISKDITDKTKIKASFTVRKKLPDALRLNPFRKFSSPFKSEAGNPFLRPSTVHKADLSVVHQKNELTLTQTVFYRDTDDEVNPFTFLGDNGETVLSYKNLGSSTAYGYSLSVKRKFPARDLEIGADIDLFQKTFQSVQVL